MYYASQPENATKSNKGGTLRTVMKLLYKDDDEEITEVEVGGG
jgi:hypothetical protein